MELGEKIKEARLALGLSQRQLCDGHITRNMLSQIENGSARPSMDTLGWLAGRLGKSVSYFLEEQAVVSPNIALMEQVRALYTQGETRKALELLEQYRQPDRCFDTEQQLLTFLCCQAEAEAALEEDRLPYARQLLEQAEGVSCPYLAEPLALRQRLLRFRAGLEPGGSLSWDGLLQARAQQDPEKASILLAACENREAPSWQLQMGHACFAAGDHAAAKAHYLLCEEAFPEEVIPRLEICFRELEDYKRAYEYACKRL